MKAILLALLLAASPSYAATTRVEAGASESVPKLTPVATPLGAPTPTLTATPLPPAALLNAPAPLPLAAAAPVSAAPSVAAPAPWSPIRAVRATLSRAKDWIAPPVISPYRADFDEHYYHGTSFEMLKRIVAGGGNLDGMATYVSNEPDYPKGYARASARKTSTPGIVLQFAKAPIEAGLVKGHDQPGREGGRVPASAALPRFMVSALPIPLAAMTDQSKNAVLGWLAVQRDLHPADSSWQPLLASFEKVLGAPAPQPRRQLSTSELSVGDKVVIAAPVPVEALYAGTDARGAKLLAWHRDRWVRVKPGESTMFAAGRASGNELLSTKILAKVNWEREAAREKRLKDYDRFLARDVWGELRPAFAAQLHKVRGLSDAKAVTAYVSEQGRQIVERLKAAHGTQDIAFHYNLHGGQPRDYVDSGLIRATMGDIALQYGMNGDRNYKVYSFHSAEHELYDVLNERNPNLYTSRMGTSLILFRRDSPTLKRALADGSASRPGSISIDFDITRLSGVPYEDFLLPPLEVFVSVARKSGARKLSRDEETLAVMRYIEAAALPAVPRS